MRLKRETQGAFCVLNANAKSQTRKSMKINVICTVGSCQKICLFMDSSRYVRYCDKETLNSNKQTNNIFMDSAINNK